MANPFAHRVFLGICADCVRVVLERSEYEVVLGRLADGPAESSSSELGSGAARFFPLVSRVGSLMVKGVAGGNVLRRALSNGLAISPFLHRTRGINKHTFCWYVGEICRIRLLLWSCLQVYHENVWVWRS
jgi:hypothetical protein